MRTEYLPSVQWTTFSALFPSLLMVCQESPPNIERGFCFNILPIKVDAVTELHTVRYTLPGMIFCRNVAELLLSTSNLLIISSTFFLLLRDWTSSIASQNRFISGFEVLVEVHTFKDWERYHWMVNMAQNIIDWIIFANSSHWLWQVHHSPPVPACLADLRWRFV